MEKIKARSEGFERDPFSRERKALGRFDTPAYFGSAADLDVGPQVRVDDTNRRKTQFLCYARVHCFHNERVVARRD